MSVVLRLKTGDTALQQAAPVVGEAAPDALPPPEPALLDWATLTPAADSHLVPCPQCGAPNGLSASSCWSCEANLLPLESIRRRRAPPTAALVPTHVPADADESLPVLTMALEGNDPTTERSMSTVPAAAAAPAPAPMPMPAADRRRYTAEIIGGSVVVVAVAAIAAALYFDTPAPVGAAKSGGFISEPAALATARPAPSPPADSVGVGSAPPAAAETSRTAALQALAVEPGAPAAAQSPPAAATDLAIAPSATPRVAPAALKAAPAGRPRSTSRSANVATALALPKRDRPDPSPTSPNWQAPAPVRACTPTVATLGLCAGPSIAPIAPSARVAPVTPATPATPVTPIESKE